MMSKTEGLTKKLRHKNIAYFELTFEICRYGCRSKPRWENGPYNRMNIIRTWMLGIISIIIITSMIIMQMVTEEYYSGMR